MRTVLRDPCTANLPTFSVSLESALKRLTPSLSRSSVFELLRGFTANGRFTLTGNDTLIVAACFPGGCWNP